MKIVQIFGSEDAAKMQWLQYPKKMQWLQYPNKMQWLQYPNKMQWLQYPNKINADNLKNIRRETRRHFRRRKLKLMN
jgi:hypothetical protein